MGEPWYSTDGAYWHATTTDRTRAILRDGLVLGKRRRWNNRFGSKLGRGDRIYLISNFHEAVRWGARMGYDFDKPVDLIKIAAPERLVFDDCIDSQMARSSFFMTDQPISPDQILRVIRLDMTHTRAVVADLAGLVPEPPEDLAPIEEAAIPGLR